MAEQEAGAPWPDVEALVAELARVQRAYLAVADDLFEPLLRTLGSQDDPPRGTGSAGRRDDGAAQRSRAAMEMSARMLRVYSEWMQGGLRYLSRVAETNGGYAGELSRRLGQLEADGADERARRELNDEARAYLRRLGDLSVQEAFALRDRLAELGAEFRDPPGDDVRSPPVRRVRAKD